MHNNQLVEQTYKRHHTWLTQVAYNFTNDKDKSAELVQDLYLKLLELKDINKIMYGTDINLFYLYKMLRSIHLNGIKKQTNNLPIDDEIIEFQADEYSYEADTDFENTVILVNEALDKAHWFDTKLLKVYIEEDHSIQSLHKATGISTSTIWTSMKKTKQYIRNYVQENKTR
jgi:DNA-directed RNA polymerase specialized sigma24 family protein